MRFANAPVSYGVFGDLTIHGAMTTDALLQEIAHAGYDGSELGPPGFFGSPADAAAMFAGAGLAAAGAYVPLHTQGTEAVVARDLEKMDATLDEIAAVDPTAVVVLADEGDDVLLRSPRKDPSLSLDNDGWARLIEVLNHAATLARRRGFEVSFHPHIATYVELPTEIERLLDTTDLSLTYDIGHVVLAGGDGVELFRAWRDRINHIHIKDVHRAVLEDARASGREDFDTWWANVCSRLGDGDSRLDEFAQVVTSTQYDRWIVVEQDRAPLTLESVSSVLADQAANFRWLSRHFGDRDMREKTSLPPEKNPSG
jgi:inosose dehydratase